MKPGAKAALAAARQRLRELATAAVEAAAPATDRAPRPISEIELFRRAVADVQPLRCADRAARHAPAPAPIPRQRERDERQALHDSLSDSVDLDTLLETDALLSYRAAGIGPDVLGKLRRGQWVIQAQLDLHGLRRDEARLALLEFVHEARNRGLRCVRVIHGKGLGSPGREAVLKHKVRTWLMQMREVLAFCQAGPHDGGAGALVVLLAAPRRGA